MFTSLLKAAAVIIDAPVAVVKDVVTLGGTLNGEKELPGDGSYTGDALARFTKNVSDIADPNKD